MVVAEGQASLCIPFRFIVPTTLCTLPGLSTVVILAMFSAVQNNNGTS